MTERLYGKTHTARLFDRHDAGFRRLADDLGVVLVDDETPLSLPPDPAADSHVAGNNTDTGPPPLLIARSAGTVGALPASGGPVFENDAPGVAIESEVVL